MLDIGAEAAGLEMNLAAVRMFTERAPPFLRRLGKKIDSAVQPDFQKVVLVLQAGEASLISQVGAIAAKTRLIMSPLSGCVPTSRGSDSSFRAVSSSIEAADMPFGKEERFGFLVSGSPS